MPVARSTRPGTPTPSAATSSRVAPASRSAASDGVGDLVRGAVRRRRRGPGEVAATDGEVAVGDEDGDLAAADVDAGEQAALGPVARCRARRSSARGSGRARGSVSSADAPSTVSSVADAAVGSRPTRRAAASGAAGRLVADGLEPRLAQRGDRAVDDDLVDVERADEARDRAAEEAAGVPRRGEGVSRHRPRGRVANVVEGRVRRVPAGGRGATIAGALATVSRQPNRPQWHSAPSSSTTMWPISPAPKPSPWNSVAVEDDAGADAAPDLDRDQVRPARGVAAEQCTRRGPRPGCRWRRSRERRSDRARSLPSGRSCQSRLTAQRMVPVRVSTTPGVPTPMPSSVRSRRPWSSSMSSWTRCEGIVAVASLDRQLDAAANLAAQVDEWLR